MSHYNVKPVQLSLKPSYWLAVILAVCSLGTCIIVIFMPMLISLKVVICVLVVLAALYYIAEQALILLPWSITGLVVNTKGELSMMRKDGLSNVANVLPSSFVASYLTVLNLKISDSRWRSNLVLIPDRADAEAFRRLRVWLRWGSFE